MRWEYYRFVNTELSVFWDVLIKNYDLPLRPFAWVNKVKVLAETWNPGL